MVVTMDIGIRCLRHLPGMQLSESQRLSIPITTVKPVAIA
jgi:hypothetical protein